MLYCSKWNKRDLNLDPTKPNVDLILAISIGYNMFKDQVDCPISFEMSCTQTHTDKPRQCVLFDIFLKLAASLGGCSVNHILAMNVHLCVSVL